MDRLVCGDVDSARPKSRCARHSQPSSPARSPSYARPRLPNSMQTFRDRFSDWPVQIRGAADFDPARVAQTVAGINAGTIDIVIGTHRLLTESINFERLGLVIIDENIAACARKSS